MKACGAARETPGSVCSRRRSVVRARAPSFTVQWPAPAGRPLLPPPTSVTIPRVWVTHGRIVVFLAWGVARGRVWGECSPPQPGSAQAEHPGRRRRRTQRGASPPAGQPAAPAPAHPCWPAQSSLPTLTWEAFLPWAKPAGGPAGRRPRVAAWAPQPWRRGSRAPPGRMEPAGEGAGGQEAGSALRHNMPAV